MNKNILITLKKELRSIFRDKKAIKRMFLFPLIIPAMIVFYGILYENVETNDNTYTVGINYNITEEEKSIAESLNIEYIYYENISEMEKEYKLGKIKGYLTLENNKYTIYADQSTTSGMTTGSLISEYLKNYNTLLTNQYLITQGVDLNEAYNHFTIEYKDLGETNYIVQILLTISITYIIMSICFSTSNMAINTTVVEKENGTLETILTFPIKKTELIIGKYLSSFILGFISSLIGLILMIVSIIASQKTFSVFSDLNITINLTSIIGSLIVIILSSIFIAGLALALTCFCKTYKEAQGTSQILSLISVLPMLINIIEIKINSLYYLIPICNYEQILIDLFTNNINIANILISIISTIILIIFVIYFIIKAYNSEKILFSK